MLFTLWRIARFYERSAGTRAYSFLFLLALVLMGGGALYYAVADIDFVGSVFPDFLLFLGGVFLTVGTFVLGQMMVGER
jgi:hypothetical protein